MAIVMDDPAVNTAKRSSVEKHDSNDSVEGEGMEISRVPEEPELELYEDGVEFPTDEEVATLRRVADKMPIGAFAIVIVELCERFAYYGTPPAPIPTF